MLSVRLRDKRSPNLLTNEHLPIGGLSSEGPPRRPAEPVNENSGAPTGGRAAARRVFDELGARRESAGAQDRSTLVDCLNQGLRLAHEQRLDLAWLVDAAYDFTADHVWEETLRPRVPGVVGSADASITTAAQALAIALVAVVERQHRHRGVTEATLRRCLNAGALEGEARDLVSYFHAECARDLGWAAESEAELRTLANRGGRLSVTAMKGLVHLQRRAGRFRDIQAGLEAMPLAPVRSRLAGDLWWTQARFDRADECYLAARDQASSQGAVGEAALSEACRAFAAGFGCPDLAAATAESALERLAAVDIAWADIQVAVGRLLAMAGADPDLDAKCDETAAKARSAGLTSSAAYAELARAFHGTVREDPDGASTARENLSTQAGARQFGYLLEIVGFWLPGEPTDGRDAAADWIDGTEITAARWRDAVRQRRAYLART